MFRRGYVVPAWGVGFVLSSVPFVAVLSVVVDSIVNRASPVLAKLGGVGSISRFFFTCGTIAIWSAL